MSPANRPELSRDDLERLKDADRLDVFEALGSFDGRDVDEDDFVLDAAELLDPARVTGLSAAIGTRDVRAVLDAVYTQACKAVHAADKWVHPAFADRDMIADADAVMANRFDFYGEVHQLPESIDWDANPGTAHWGHDLNRFSFLRPLREAFKATGDARYARKAVELILDWIAKADLSRCFAGTPYVFGSYLNNAIHCQQWTYCLAELLPAGQVRPTELMRILKSVHDQMAYLQVVTNGHRGNWPTIGAAGIMTPLAGLPLFRDTGRLTDYCSRLLDRQLGEQVLPDGVQFELTPHYHWTVIRFVMDSLKGLRALGASPAPRIIETFGRMIHYLQQTLVPDGSRQVAFNDSDPAHVPQFRDELVELGLERFLTPTEQLGPECFPYAGVAFLRDRADEGDYYLAFDAGPYGASHQHEDKLGFWLFANGRSLLVDPGRHLYDPHSYRPYLISTAAHSTILVDGRDQHSAGRRDTWVAREPLDLGWSVDDREVRAAGVYDLGYGDDNAIAVSHRREIVYIRRRFWVIFDTVAGEGEHDVESRFQFAPGPLELTGSGAHTAFDAANLLLLSEPAGGSGLDDVRIECGQEDPRRGWYSDIVNHIEPAPALAFRARRKLPLRIATLLLPYRGPTPPAVEFTFDGQSARVSVGGGPSTAVAPSDPG